MIHELKILPQFFKAVKNKSKTFEIRTNDRPFALNDTLVLNEWTGSDYTGERVEAKIKYILDDKNYLKRNTVAMSIELIEIPVLAQYIGHDEWNGATFKCSECGNDEIMWTTSKYCCQCGRKLKF